MKKNVSNDLRNYLAIVSTMIATTMLKRFIFNIGTYCIGRHRTSIRVRTLIVVSSFKFYLLQYIFHHSDAITRQSRYFFFIPAFDITWSFRDIIASF